MNSCPLEMATVLRQYGAQSFSNRFDEMISNFGPARYTVVSPSYSVVTKIFPSTRIDDAL